MAKYRVETPDGMFEIDTPDNLSDDQIREVVRTKLTAEGKTYANAPNRINPPKQFNDPETDLLSDIGSGVAEIGRGFASGAAGVLDNVADFAQSGLNLLGGAGDKLNSLWGSGQNNLAGQVAAPTQGLETLRGIGQFAGEAAATAPTAALRGGALVQGAVGGAVLSDEQDAAGVVLDAATGAVGGGVGASLLRGAGALVGGRQVSAQQRTLLNEGVRLTPGSLVPRGSQVKRLEDIAATTPLVQGPVRAAQEQAVGDLNRAAVNRALRPIRERVPDTVEVGHDAIRYAGDRLSAAYGDVLPRLSGKADSSFARRVRTVVTRADLPPGYEEQSQAIVNEALKAFRPRNPVTGVDTPITMEQIGQLPPTEWVYNGRRLRDASERLGAIASDLRASSGRPYDRILGDVAQQLRDQLHSLARRGNPADAARLRDIDRGYASLVRVERGAAGTADGVMTPAQYDAGVRGADRSTRRRQSARGRALDQDLSSAGRQVMQNTAAQGGSRDVNSLAMLATLGGAAMFGKPAALAGLAGIGAGRAAYTPVAQDAIRALMSRNPGLTAQRAAAILQAGSRAAPIVAPAAIDVAGD